MKPKKIEISHEKEVFVVYTNTDLTEGRGHQYPLHVCEAEATANRLKKRKGVQGTDADVIKNKIFYHEGTWYGPVSTVSPTKEDEQVQKELDALKELAAKQKLVFDKARQLGLTDDEIEILKKK